MTDDDFYFIYEFSERMREQDEKAEAAKGLQGVKDTERYLQKKELLETISFLNDLAFAATGRSAIFYFRTYETVCRIYTKKDCIHESAILLLKTRRCVKQIELPSEDAVKNEFTGYYFVLDGVS